MNDSYGIGDFVREKCVQDGSSTSAIRDLYTAYVAHRNNPLQTASKQLFSSYVFTMYGGKYLTYPRRCEVVMIKGLRLSDYSDRGEEMDARVAQFCRDNLVVGGAVMWDIVKCCYGEKMEMENPPELLLSHVLRALQIDPANATMNFVGRTREKVVTGFHLRQSVAVYDPYVDPFLKTCCTLRSMYEEGVEFTKCGDIWLMFRLLNKNSLNQIVTNRSKFNQHMRYLGFFIRPNPTSSRDKCFKTCSGAVLCFQSSEYARAVTNRSYQIYLNSGGIPPYELPPPGPGVALSVFFNNAEYMEESLLLQQ